MTLIAPLRLIIVDDENSVGLISQLQFRQAIKSGILDFHYFEQPQLCLEFLTNIESMASEKTVILTDINMPDITGYDLLEKIKQQFPEIEVFMMSAYSDESYISRSLELGASGYFTKPVNYKNIKLKIEEDYGVAL